MSQALETDVVVVGLPGLKGLHALVRVLTDLVDVWLFRVSGEVLLLARVGEGAGLPEDQDPDAELFDVRLVQSERYERVERQMQGLIKRTPECALHVHVGLPDADAAVAAKMSYGILTTKFGSKLEGPSRVALTTSSKSALPDVLIELARKYDRSDASRMSVASGWTPRSAGLRHRATNR